MLIWTHFLNAVLLTLALAKVSSTMPLIFFMDDCSNEQIYYSITTSAIVYSHRGYLTRTKYDFSFRCILRFTPALPKWRIAVKVLDYDLPVEPYLDGSCSDNLVFSNLTLSYYNNKIAVMDDRNQFASGEAVYICNQMRKKHGNNTLEYFSEGESQFYVGFETGSVAKGNGFKLLLTAFTSAANSETCAAAVRDQKSSLLFPCGHGPDAYCINSNLTCDRMPNCPGIKDVADEPPVRSCSPKTRDAPVSFIDKLLSLGVAASLSISIGTVLVALICLVISICLCRRCCRDKKRRPPGSTASYGVGPVGGAYCANSRTGSAVGGPGGGSFISANQRGQFPGNATVTSGGGPYNSSNMYNNSASVIKPPQQDYRVMSPSRFSENVGSVGGGSLSANYWGNQYGMMPPQQQQQLGNGVRVQYMVAPRHFGASPNPVQPSYASVNDSGSPRTTRPSQISSSGFGGSQTQALPPYNTDGYHTSSVQQGRSTTPSSKSARSNGAASSSYATGAGALPAVQQPLLFSKQPNNNNDEESTKREEQQQPLTQYGRSTQQVNL